VAQRHFQIVMGDVIECDPIGHRESSKLACLPPVGPQAGIMAQSGHALNQCPSIDREKGRCSRSGPSPPLFPFALRT
jgi:hypothetical protein